MSRCDEDLQTKLEAQARAVIAELLAHKKPANEITLTEIEQAVRRAGQAFQQALTAELVQASAGQVELTVPVCQQCGQPMKAKGQRRRRVVAETGEVQLAREYYYCAACRSGLFPPGPALGIGAECLQPGPG